MFDLDVGNGRRLFARAQGVFAVLGDFEARHAGGGDTVNQRRERAIAFAGKFDRLAIPQDADAAEGSTWRSRAPER